MVIIMNLETKFVYSLSMCILISMASAIPIEPVPGEGPSSMDNADSLPLEQTPLPLLPYASTIAMVAAVFFTVRLKPRFLTDSETYRVDANGERLWLRGNSAAGENWVETSLSNQQEYLEYLRSILKNSASDKIPVRNSEGKWVLQNRDYVKRYFDMLDSAEKTLKDLEKKKEKYRAYYIRYKKRNGKSYWRTRTMEKAYNETVGEIEKVKKTIGTLNSWSKDLNKLDFNSDKGFRFNERTFFLSNGILRGISAEEAELRFRRKAKEAYAEYKESVKGIYSELTSKIKRLGWQIVDYSLDTLESTYNAFRQKLKQLKDEYETERSGRKGLWTKYFKKLYENYYTDFRDKSEELYEDYVESINHKAYVDLVPESVKLEIRTKERERLMREKEDMRWKKRRWCCQLMDRARRQYKELEKDYKRLYDGELYENLKQELDEWCDKALADAKKLRWQRTLEKAENRFNEIDDFITDGFNEFNGLTNRTVANNTIEEFYRPKESTEGIVQKQIEEYNEEQRDALLAYQSAVLNAETQAWIEALNGKVQVIKIPSNTTTTSNITAVMTTAGMMPTTCTIQFDEKNGVNSQQILNDVTNTVSTVWDWAQKPVSGVIDFIKRPYYEGTVDLQNQPIVVRFGNRIRYTEEWCAAISCFEGRENGWMFGAGPQIKLKIKGIGGGLGGDIFIDRSGDNTTIAQSAGLELNRKNSEFIADYTLPLIQRTFDNETNKTTLFTSRMTIDIMAAATNSTAFEEEKCLVNDILLTNCTISPSLTCEYTKEGYWISDQMNATGNVTIKGFDENGTYRILDYDGKTEMDTPLELGILEFFIKLGGDAENFVKGILSN
jgi:hypothetical protein